MNNKEYYSSCITTKRYRRINTSPLKSILNNHFSPKITKPLLVIAKLLALSHKFQILFKLPIHHGKSVHSKQINTYCPYLITLTAFCGPKMEIIASLFLFFWTPTSFKYTYTQTANYKIWENPKEENFSFASETYFTAQILYVSIFIVQADAFNLQKLFSKFHITSSIILSKFWQILKIYFSKGLFMRNLMLTINRTDNIHWLLRKSVILSRVLRPIIYPKKSHCKKKINF